MRNCTNVDEAGKPKAHQWTTRAHKHSRRSYRTCICGLHETLVVVLPDPNKKVGRANKRIQHRNIRSVNG